MAERSHCWTDRRLISLSLFLWPSPYLPTYRPTYLPTHVPTYLSTELATTFTLATTLTGNRLTLQLQACNELRLLPRDHVQWITAAAASSCMQWITATAAPSCGQKKHTRWRSTPTLRNDHVQWITAACNELQLLLRHRAVRKNTHATKLEL